MKVNSVRREQTWLTVVVAVVLIMNSILLGRSLNLYRLPGELDAPAIARAGAELVVDHLGRLADSSGLGSNKAVQDTLAVMLFEITKAGNADEVSLALQLGILETQTVMAREEEALRRDAVLAILRGQRAVQNVKAKATLTLSRAEGRSVSVKGPPGLVTEELLLELSRHKALSRSFATMTVEVENAEVRVLTPSSLTARINSLEQEAAALRVELQTLRTQAGYLPMTGSGVRVRVFDAFRGLVESDIVHDGDVRDIVNELFAAGASGVAVGQQRLVANSSIRCAGPVILINHRPISVDPVIIEAVGDSAVLSSGLQLIRASLLASRGVQVEVEIVRNITLPAFLELIAMSRNVDEQSVLEGG